MSLDNSSILRNVFLSTGGNCVKLVDIYFSGCIKKIIEKTPALEWSEINNAEKRERFRHQFQAEDAPPGFKLYDGNYLLVMPGGIDSHVHFDTPGFEDREDFEHASLAAASGGVTTVIDMPCTSIPPVTRKENFQTKLNSLKHRSLVDYSFYGGVCGNDFDNSVDIEMQIKELARLGVAAFKVYMISGMDTFNDLNEERLLESAGWIKETGRPMAVHAEDKKRIQLRISETAGRNDWQAFCFSRDDIAEANAIDILVNIARKTDCRIHIVHLSSKAGLDIIRKAQADGLMISTETCPHYLYFTQENFDDSRISSWLKTTPPVKKLQDREALWDGLNDESISFVVTDHAGCDPRKEKSSDNFWEIYGGIPGVEHRVPFLFSKGFLKQKLTLTRTIELLTSNIADYFNLKGKGYIRDGFDADFTLLDLWNSEQISSGKMHSKGKYTPFEGVNFNAVVQKTFLRGALIFNRSGGIEKSTGYGRFLEVQSENTVPEYL